MANDYDPKRHPANAIAEIKYDGMMVLVEDGRLINRRLRDVTGQFPEIHVDSSVVLVGELVILQNGISQFHMMQRRNTDNPKEVAIRSKLMPATFVAFDVLEVKGQDFSKDPLSKRRELLQNLEKTGLVNEHVFVAGFWGCPPEKVDDYLQLMRDQHCEGIMVKNLDAPYSESRSHAWQKKKAWHEADYDILRYEDTDAGGFVIWISNKGYEQKIVVNNQKFVQGIRDGRIQRLTIRFLDEEPATKALRQPHVHGLPLRK